MPRPQQTISRGVKFALASQGPFVSGVTEPFLTQKRPNTEFQASYLVCKQYTPAPVLDTAVLEYCVQIR